MKDKLARGVVWVSAARALINLIGLASTLLLARLLMPEDFGLVAIAMTFVTIVGSVTELSLSAALVQHDEPSEAHYDTAFTLSAARSMLLGMTVAALAWPVGSLYGDMRLFPVLLVIAASISITGFGNPRMVIFTRRLEFWQDFAFGVSGKLVGFLVAVGVAYFYRSYWALVISTVVVQLQGLALSYAFLPRRPRFSLFGWRDLMGFSVWVSLSQAVSTLNWRSDSLFIGYFLGPQPLGYYTFGDNLASMPTREATAPIAQTLFPAFSRLQGDRPRLRQAYQRSQAMLCAAALPVGFGFAILAEPLVLLTVGPKWLPAVIVIQVLSSVFATHSLASSVHPLAMALGETRLMFRRELFFFLVRLPMIIAGLVMGGLIGVIIARCISGIFFLLVNMMLVQRLIQLSIIEQLRANLRSFVAVGVMCAVLAAAQLILRENEVGQFVRIGAQIMVGCLTYFTALFGLWLAVGKPPGPETELTNVVSRLWSILSRSLAERAVR